MKTIFTIIWAIVCAAVLIFGHSYWKERTVVKADNAKGTAAALVEQPNGSEMLAAKTKNWPEQARSQFQQSLKQNKPFKILFVGSKALGSKDQGMLKDVYRQLTSAYGSHIDISIDTYDTTSTAFLADKDESEIAAEKAQLIVLEPFLLNNNGNVAIGDSLSNLTKIMDAVKATDPEAVFILQPSFPLYQAIHYPVQVSDLKQYAADHHITYLDHWTVWPDTNNPELKNDLLPDQSAPSSKGNQIWSQYLIHYFIS